MILEPGMVITIEPGFATRYGSFHCEEDVVVTERGCEVVSCSPRTLWHIAAVKQGVVGDESKRSRGRHSLRSSRNTRRGGGTAINLCPSENILSPAVRRALDSDLLGRYGDYTGRDLTARHYYGTRTIVEIEQAVTELARSVFCARYVDLRPLSGHNAGQAVIMGLTRPGDVVLEAGRDYVGHRLATKVAMAPLAKLRVEYLPLDAQNYAIDVEGTLRLVEKLRPRMVILGNSAFLFPHPVRAIKEGLKDFPGTVLVYDASHVMGLIAGGRFQAPLDEGADVVFGSTHKTLPGPQGGIIFSNNDELMDEMTQTIYPGLVTNHHLFRLPALGICLLEMRKWGTVYADQVICNAQALGEALHERGATMVNRDGCYSRSHTVLVNAEPYGPAQSLAELMERANVIVSTVRLPDALGGQGIRLGTQEVTRLGARTQDMAEIAELLVELISGGKDAGEVLPKARDLARRFRRCHYTWDE